MGVSSYFEFVTVLFGWIMYDRLWAVLNDTGIVFLPFVIIFVNHIIESRKGGDDEGSAAIQSLKKCETDILVAMVVLFVAAVPFTEVRLAEMSYVRPTLDCAVERRMEAGVEPREVDASASRYGGAMATLDGEHGRIPIWWGLVHMLSKAVVAGSVAAIPCSNDLVSLSGRLGGDRIEDVELLHETIAFTNDCHRPAVSCLERKCKTIGSDIATANREKAYIGSEWFLSRPGFYPMLRSSQPRDAWLPVESPRDDDMGGGAHPMCDEWWLDPDRGLRERLVASIDGDTRNELIYDEDGTMRREYAGASEAELEDMLLRRYLAIQQVGTGAVSYEADAGEVFRQQGNVVGGAFAVAGDVGIDVLTNFLAGVGMLLKAPGAAAEGIVIREGAPIFLALLLMIFVVALPFLMVFSRYDPGVLINLSLIFFAFQFVYVLWGVAFWIDQNLYAVVGPGSGGPTPNPIQLGMMVWIQRLLYYVFPLVWIAALGWVGVRAQEAFQAGVTAPSAITQGAVRGGTDQVVSGAAQAATGGRSVGGPGGSG